MQFQTDLIVSFLNGSELFIGNVHPDSSFAIRDGVLTVEDLDGEKIHYIPAMNIRNYYTVCVSAHD